MCLPGFSESRSSADESLTMDQSQTSLSDDEAPNWRDIFNADEIENAFNKFQTGLNMIEEEDYDSSGSDSCPSADGFDEKDFKHLLIRAMAPKKKKTTPL